MGWSQRWKVRFWPQNSQSNNAARGRQGPTTSHPPWSPNRTTEKSAPPIQDLPLQKAATRKSCRPSPGPRPCWVPCPCQLEPPPSSEAAIYSPCLWAGPSSKPAQSNTSGASHMWPLSARNVVLMDVCCTHGTHTQDLEDRIPKRMENISIILYSGYILR